MKNKILLCIGLLFIAISIGVFIKEYKILIASYRATNTWTKEYCKINSCKIEEHYESSGGGSTTKTYSIKLNYTYKIDNKEYNGVQYAFWKRTGNFKKLNNVVKKLNQQTYTKCLVNPLNPNESVINSDIDFYWILTPIIIFLFFLFSGLICIFISLPLSGNNK